jgi:hypothetical protein
MSLDRFLESRKKKTTAEIAKKVVEENPIALTITIDYFTKAINEDYYDKLKDSELLKKYMDLKGIKSVNLNRIGYKLTFDESRCTLGYCSYGDKTINLSLKFIKGTDDWLAGRMESVILHEFSHAITDFIFTQSEIRKLDPMDESSEGHGILFKEVCSMINPEGDCSRFAHDVQKGKEFKLYKAKCPKCGKENYSDDPGTGQCFLCKTYIKYKKN